MNIFLIAAIAISIAAAFVASHLAISKNRNAYAWAFATVLLSGLPLLILIFLPQKQPARAA